MWKDLLPEEKEEYKKLASALNDYGFSQVKIANLMDVTQPTISKAIKEYKEIKDVPDAFYFDQKSNLLK